MSKTFQDFLSLVRAWLIDDARGLAPGPRPKVPLGRGSGRSKGQGGPIGTGERPRNSSGRAEHPSCGRLVSGG